MKLNKYSIYLIFISFYTAGFTANITHGPMVGHTTDTSTQIWIRADSSCVFFVQAESRENRITYISDSVHLLPENNYCGTAIIKNLSPLNTYIYSIYLNDQKQTAVFKQEFTTFPGSKDSGIVRIGFGHSIRGPEKQTTWKAIAEKKPHLFILMGDNVYSNSTVPKVQREMYLNYRSDPFFSVFGATTPIYAVWDDHDYGLNNSDRNQPGKERSLKTFYEIWSNPPSEANNQKGIWTHFKVGCADFFLLDVRYYRSPDDDLDNSQKTMLGREQLTWLKEVLSESEARFKFLVSGSSWNCGGVESWNHRFTYEYNDLLSYIFDNRISGILLLGGDQHECKIAVRPRESWGGYDLHEWMAGQIWEIRKTEEQRAFGLITINTQLSPAAAKVEFFDGNGNPYHGKRILYTIPGALRTLWNSPEGITGKSPPRSIDGELRPNTSGSLWDSLPNITSETLTEDDLKW